MDFYVVDRLPSTTENHSERGYLIKDKWDDWGKYQTQYYLVIFDAHDQKHEIGSVKIGQVGLRPAVSSNMERGKTRAPSVPDHFESLDDTFFSLGQGENYYETLNQLDDPLRYTILDALNDIALKSELYEKVKTEDVMGESLMRQIPKNTLEKRLRNLAHGNAHLTAFEFTLDLSAGEFSSDSPKIDFSVRPGSRPPTNVHVLIGRNGVGKTTALRDLITQLSKSRETGGGNAFVSKGEKLGAWDFSGLVVVAFSVFDGVFHVAVDKPPIPMTMVGVFKERKGKTGFRMKGDAELANDFSRSLAKCKVGLRRERWMNAVQLLQTDPLFADAHIDALLETEESEWDDRARRVFSRLSSGHSIVLLTITRLVELVDERTLVLIDEPESHLHPPLLSAFVRCLSALLIRRNGVAIVATHSPVVLQEVPRTCAWVLNRTGSVVIAERPMTETFGENVGVLTHSVFGLEVTNTGFYQLLRESVGESPDYKTALAQFDEQMGSEGRAILRSLFSSES